jgi:hypothetical protein
MDKKDEQIEKKLLELESSVLESANLKKTTSELDSEATTKLIESSSPNLLQSDLYLFSGLASFVFGLLILFQHIRVGTGFMQALGLSGGGFGLLLIPMIFGIAWIIYNPQNKIGYGIVAVTCALIFFTVMSSLIMTFQATSLLGLIIMLLPFALGGALVLKGLGGPKGVQEKLKEKGLLK